MKASELITKLKDAIERHGDIHVTVRDEAGEFDSIKDIRREDRWQGNSLIRIDTSDGDPTP